MIQIMFVLFALAIVACNANAPVTPAIVCGEIPSNIYSCLGNPKLVKPGVSTQCSSSTKEVREQPCDGIKCIFQKSGWMNGETVNLQKVESYFDQFAKDHPDWAPAVQQVKIGCLKTQPPPQGAFLNCPAYDVLMCTVNGFVKNAQPSQWSTSSDCAYTRHFAAYCPLCPGSCFASLIPQGSCNACILPPSSP